MKVFVTGVNGQLGYDVMNELNKRHHDAIGSDITMRYSGMMPLDIDYIQLDITDQEAVNRMMDEVCPDVVIHCAAWTAVDAAEDNQDKVKEINVDGTRYIAEAVKKIDAKMVYISTDYVFDGQGDVPWDPDCQDYAPLNVYGQSKLDGEKAVAELLDHYYIVRIAWVFGVNGNNFIKTMLKVGKTHKKLRVVNDQIGTPTYTYDLARLLLDMTETDQYGYYHVTNTGGYISWYDFAKAIFEEAGEDYADVVVAPVSTADYGLSKAKRPFNSRLDQNKLIEKGFTPLPSWEDALRRYIKDIDY